MENVDPGIGILVAIDGELGDYRGGRCDELRTPLERGQGDGRQLRTNFFG